MKLIRDQREVEELQSILNSFDRQVGGKTMERTINQVRQRPKTGREMRLAAQIGDYDMDQVVLDIG